MDKTFLLTALVALSPSLVGAAASPPEAQITPAAVLPRQNADNFMGYLSTDGYCEDSQKAQPLLLADS